MSATATPPVVTRFAPSPTGFLHIGSARTALFNWMFAKAQGGRFVLRIEDTDRARSTKEAVDAILDGMAWLGLTWDGDAVFQSARADRHREAAEALLEAGAAYRCYVTPEALDARRAEAERLAARAKAPLENGLSADDVAAMKAAADQLLAAYRSPYRDGGEPPRPDAPFVVRLRGPRDGETVIDDQVQGGVTFANRTLDDLVLLRADGAPTYNLAVVVDDHDMGVTHVIRGDDHLVNAARQTRIYEALGWTPPVFAHIPLIHGPDGKKLSKRHGALGVEGYRDMGYSPEGLRNYLLRLGWAHGDMETFTDAEAARVFDFGGMTKAAARLDLEKLASVNAWHLRQADPQALQEALAPAFEAAYGAQAASAAGRARLGAALPHLVQRAKTADDMVAGAGFLFLARPITLNKGARKALKGDAVARLARLAQTLSAHDDWSDDALQPVLKAFAESEDVGMGKVGGPLRAALTGGAPAPDITVVLALLGKDDSLGRVEDAIGAMAAADASE